MVGCCVGAFGSPCSNSLSRSGPAGRSRSPTLPAYGRWLAQEVQERAAGAPVVLLGHSLGGSVVLHAASLLGDQLQGIVLLGCGGGVYQRRPFTRLRQVGCALSLFQGDRRAARGLLLNSTQRRAVAGLPKLVSQLAVPSLWVGGEKDQVMLPLYVCLLYTSPSPRDLSTSRMPSSA